MAIAFDTLPKLKGLEPKLVPPRGAKAVGIYEMPGEADKIIYEQKIFDQDATKETKQPVLDAEGNEVWRKHQTTGERLVQVMKVEPKYRVRRFILRAFGNGKVKCVENFESTPAERAEDELRRKREHWMEDFRDLAVERGLSPHDAIRMFLDQNSTESEELTVDEDALAAEADEMEGVLSTSLPLDPGGYTVEEFRALDLTGYSLEEKALIREAEQTGKNRSTVLAAID